MKNLTRVERLERAVFQERLDRTTRVSPPGRSCTGPVVLAGGSERSLGPTDSLSYFMVWRAVAA